MSELHRIAGEIVAACRRMDERGLVGGGEGNLSVRLDEGTLLVTPSLRNKGGLASGDLIEIDLASGERLSSGIPTSELALHLSVHRALVTKRPEWRAVAHGHPLAAIAHTVAGRPLLPLVAEAAALFPAGAPVAPYATPGTPAVGDSVAPFVAGGAAVVLLERHGAIAFGSDPAAAVDRLELLERAALVSLYTALLGGADPLSPEAIAAALASAARHGFV